MEPTLPQPGIIQALSKTFNGIYKYQLRPQLQDPRIFYVQLLIVLRSGLES